uniref:Uncharacterized protein n=1 Tax=Knipowitschia caucasica TaxID=637954 RepID=A0AAV2LQ59_KNICA
MRCTQWPLIHARSPGAAGLQHSLGTSGTRLFTHDMYLCACALAEAAQERPVSPVEAAQEYSGFTLSTGRGSWTT